MSQREGDRMTVKCAACGHVFDVGAETHGMLLSDHPVSVGGQDTSMTAQGMATVVADRGPERTSPDEWPAYVCPQCGRAN